MALKAKPSELLLTRRHLMRVLITLPLLLALLGFGLQGRQVPSWPSRLAEAPLRGTIVAADGTVLAEGPAEHRRYPQGPLAAHLVGFSGREQPDGRFGLEGLEFTYDRALQGGESVTLTIDPTLQAAAQSKLRDAVLAADADNGTVVMLEVGSGRILAAASYPDFDPNEQSAYPRSALVNRAFLQEYEPGSVMKPFVVAALIESGRLDPNEIIDAKMSQRVGTKTFRDVSPHPEQISVKDVLRYSSNVGMLHLTERFTPEELYNWLAYYGFGQTMGLTSVYTRSGLLHAWQRWVPQDQASITIGQSVSTTALQLAAAYSIFANDGAYVTPYLVEGESVPEPYPVLSATTARELRAMLKYTAEESGIRHSIIPGVTLAGKTGTADVFDRELGTYPDGDYTLTFAGMFPAEEPRIVMVVYVQKPRLETLSTYVAAPLFRAIGSEAVATWGLAPAATPYAATP